jgi:hypothetical protein
VKQLFDRAGAIAAIVGPALPGWRRLLAGAIAPVVLALWSSGGMAASSDCVGATGTSAVTPTPAFLYLQCYKSIQIPGNPLQTFGGSALIRTNATEAYPVGSGPSICSRRRAGEPAGAFARIVSGTRHQYPPSRPRQSDRSAYYI